MEKYRSLDKIKYNKKGMIPSGISEDIYVQFTPNDEYKYFYDSIRMLDDPSYPDAYLRLENVYIEFSEISRKGKELFCKVRISPRDLK